MSFNDLSSGKLIPTEKGPAFVRIIGDGPPVFVVHGGPGFNHRYLIPALEFLTSSRKLIFFDQPGCGKTPFPAEPLTLDFVAGHMSCLVRRFTDGVPASLIAHSWGSLLSAACLQTSRLDGLTELNFSKSILILPAPMKSENYLQAYNRLIERLPKDLSEKVFRLLEDDYVGSEIMDMVIPYYGLETARNPDGIIELNNKVYREITFSLGQFDFSHTIERLGEISLIYGKEDILGLSLAGSLVDHARRKIEIPSAAHFPFFENPAGFRKAITDALSH